MGWGRLKIISPFRPLKGKPGPALVSLLGDGRGWLFEIESEIYGFKIFIYL
jgi:hypothetical protein